MGIAFSRLIMHLLTAVGPFASNGWKGKVGRWTGSASRVSIGRKSYMVMTDSQLAEAAKPDALTPDVLRRIEGFGEMRIKKYGERLLVDVT